MQSVYKLPQLLEPQPEGGYTITCPLLPSLITEADSLDQVIPTGADALAALIEACQDLKKTLPTILQPLQAGTTIWTEMLIPARAA